MARNLGHQREVLTFDSPIMRVVINTNNEREISIPHEALPSAVLQFPDNSRAITVLTFSRFKLNTLHKETLTNRQILTVEC